MKALSSGLFLVGSIMAWRLAAHPFEYFYAFTSGYLFTHTVTEVFKLIAARRTDTRTH